MTRDELIQLVRFVQAAAGTEDEIDRALTALDAHVPHPAISDLIFFPAENCERSAEEIVDTALSHEPIAPGISMETTPAEETVHEGKWLRMKRRGQWEYCERTHGRDGMAVIIIAVTPQDEVLFVEQYRVPLGARTIEMPAGLVGDLVHGDGMEDTLERAAQRELAEETGIRARNLTPLYRTVSERSQAIHHGFLCVTDCDKNAIVLQPGETIGWKWLKRDALLAFAESDAYDPAQRQRLLSCFEAIFSPQT